MSARTGRELWPSGRFDPLHSYFVARLVPVCAGLLEAATGTGQVRPDLDAYEIMRGVGSICAGAGAHRRYDVRRLVGFLVAGLRQPESSIPDR